MQNQGFIIAREGFRWIGIGLMLMLASFYLGWTFLTFLLSALTLFIAFFFRNPNRTTPPEPGLIVSPADGKICMIAQAYEKRFLQEPRQRISIFMSVLNCHVNRSPASAKLLKTHYHPGKFHLANVDKASDFNEQHSLLLEDAYHNQFVLVQIAGFVARRIVSYVKTGDHLAAGQRFGLIQFGSRVDIYLPKNAIISATVGQQVRGGETVLGKLA